MISIVKNTIRQGYICIVKQSNQLLVHVDKLGKKLIYGQESFSLCGMFIIPINQYISGADPGFPIGGRQPLLEGAPTSDTGTFWWKHM